jgi:HEAT repeat protein
MKFRVLPTVSIFFLTVFSVAKAEVSVEGDMITFDGVPIKKGESLRITGPITSTDYDQLRLSMGSAVLCAAKINGRANQDAIVIHLVLPGGWKQAQRLKKGSWFEVTGKWSDAKWKGANKIISLRVGSLKPVKPFVAGFADFAGRAAVFKGIAQKGGKVRCGAETAVMDNLTAWPAGITGKEVEVRGVMKKTGRNWQFTVPSWRLEKLADQVGKDVEVEGTLWSLNGCWWLEYRDERVCLIEESGRVMKFESGAHGVSVRVKGRLLKQLRPALNQISEKVDRDLVPQFVIRAPKVNFPAGLLTEEERFRTLDGPRQKTEDEVPLLLAGISRQNLWGTETMAQLYVETNRASIDALLEAPSQAQKDVMAKRLETSKDAAIRLIYAAMLAACNDERGREALLKALKEKGSENFTDALYCMGIFSFLLPKNSSVKTETEWAEDPLIGLLKQQPPLMVFPSHIVGPAHSGEDKISVEEACGIYTFVFDLLINSKSEKGRTTVLEIALSGKPAADSAIRALCFDEAPCSVEILSRLAATAKPRKPDLRVLQKLLKQNEPAAAHLFGDVLAESSVYSIFREAMTPELARALKEELPNLPSDPTALAKILIISQEKDPVPAWLKLLESPEWEDKNTVVWELMKLKDPRTLQPIVRCLHLAKQGYFKTSASFGSALPIEHCLQAIADIGGDEAVRGLIGLLQVDFGRQKEDYLNDAALHRVVAAHLIELTGESFGVDAAAWRKWFDAGKPRSE